MKQLKERGMKTVFLLAACTSILAVALICIFLFLNGFSAIGKIGLADFLLGRQWKPLNDIYGIFPMIVGSIYVTAGAMLIGVPIGLLCAVFLAEFCPPAVYRIVKPAVDLLAGIPSVVYGFFALMVIVPIMQDLFGVSGKNMITASVLLGLMILPTIIGVSEAAIRAVPESYYEGALALGATRERSVFAAVLPAAKSGILAGGVRVHGIGSGEKLAVSLVAGNQAELNCRELSGVRTMTANIVMEMGYATGLHREALIATAVVLFVFILIINLAFSLLKRRDKA